jgi:hypothetical protein
VYVATLAITKRLPLRLIVKLPDVAFFTSHSRNFGEAGPDRLALTGRGVGGIVVKLLVLHFFRSVSSSGVSRQAQPFAVRVIGVGLGDGATSANLAYRTGKPRRADAVEKEVFLIRLVTMMMALGTTPVNCARTTMAAAKLLRKTNRGAWGCYELDVVPVDKVALGRRTTRR